MQDGDLALWDRPRYVIVVEGVFGRVTPVVRQRRFRGAQTTGYNVSWFDVPIKRALYMKDRWPETGQDLVTFVSQELCDQVAEFLADVGLQHDQISYQKFDRFVNLLPYQRDVQRVYDSEPHRLDRYGQLGHAVVPGEDF